LYSLDAKQLHFVTSDRYESFSPSFSTDGKWLYFISSRNFNVVNNSPWGDRNMGAYFDKRNGIYALALQAGNRFPFKADDELSKDADKASEEKKPDAADKVADKAADKASDKAADKAAENQPNQH